MSYLLSLDFSSVSSFLGTVVGFVAPFLKLRGQFRMFFRRRWFQKELAIRKKIFDLRFYQKNNFSFNCKMAREVMWAKFFLCVFIVVFSFAAYTASYGDAGYDVLVMFVEAAVCLFLSLQSWQWRADWLYFMSNPERAKFLAELELAKLWISDCDKKARKNKSLLTQSDVLKMKVEFQEKFRSRHFSDE